MKIQWFQDNQTIIKELGVRIKYKRIAMNMTQKDLQEASRVSMRTISSFENGENISLNHLISILRSLKLLDDLNSAFQETKVNPFEVLKLGHKRQRASKKSKKTSTWEWGE